jgi:hypothetical protein
MCCYDDIDFVYFFKDDTFVRKEKRTEKWLEKRKEVCMRDLSYVKDIVWKQQTYFFPKNDHLMECAYHVVFFFSFFRIIRCTICMSVAFF